MANLSVTGTSRRVMIFRVLDSAPPMTARRPQLRIAPTASTSDAAHSFLLTDCAQVERRLQRYGLHGLRTALSDGRTAAESTGWTHFWRGYSLQFENLALARIEWLAAEARFADEGDTPGLDIVACGLIQCTLLDTQSYDGFEERAKRVEHMGRGQDERTPLALFALAARLLLISERRESVEGVTDDIEKAFAALGADIDHEIALRVATAALPMLGLTLDRVRSEDFFQASAAVAASSQVGAYSRALWHLLLVDALFYDATWAPRLHSELDALEGLARSNNFSSLLARAHLIRASMALGEGNVAAGRASLDAAHPLLNPAHPPNYWEFHYYSSRHALQVGSAEDAWGHAKVSLRKMQDAGVTAARTTPALMQQGFVLVALRRFEDAAAAFARAGSLSRGAQATPCLVHVHLTRALQQWREGAHDEARAELGVGFAHARSFDLTHFFRALPRVAAELCGAALELKADPPFACKVIAARSLACPDIGIVSWPWPLRVRTLGGFAIERDGVPLKFARKAPKRLLDLLRLIAALGGLQVDAARAAAMLWPDAEGDEARDALKTVLHRARALLGADLLVVRGGQIAFDDSLTWVDTWAFDHVCGRIEALLGVGMAATQVDDGELELRRVQLFSLYRGHLFGEAEVPSWALASRDRLRARFIRSIEALGQRLERVGRTEAAIALYRAALEQDNLAEEIYQRLISCHLARGENAQALNAYRRCRELLSIVLGVPPSTRTEALVSRIGSR
jgi:LuxR family transcriptional regulator, maltose regulon positive regulatory protein